MKKYCSRKFLACVMGALTGLATVFGLDEGAISTICGAVISVFSVVAYISAEGRIDAAAVGKAAGDIQTALDAIREERDDGEDSE